MLSACFKIDPFERFIIMTGLKGSQKPCGKEMAWIRAVGNMQFVK